MILLIDDDLDDCDIFCEAVKDISNEECNYIHDAQHAIKYLMQSAQSPTCIFLDINLPPTNGFSVLKSLKANEDFAHIPVIMYSTSASRKDIEKSKELGAYSYIQKSTSYQDLIKSLKSVNLF